VRVLDEPCSDAAWLLVESAKRTTSKAPWAASHTHSLATQFYQGMLYA